MRRVVSTVTVASGVLGLSLGLVGASLGFGAVAASAAAGKKMCTITDARLTELSGMIATSNGYVVINDSSDDADRERVFLLDNECKVKKPVQYGGNGARDPEDLAISADGRTVWVADIGDNVTSQERRTSVVLWSMPVSGASRPVLHRLTYPGGKPHDAEALLIGADGVPLIITKTTGKSEIYRPSSALEKNNTEGVPLVKAGEIGLPRSTTANPFGPAGRLSVTGAARSPDGSRIVLRTYADAFEWDVQDDDLVKTLTTGTPRATPLADPFGEAIAYTPDGRTFLTVSDVASLGEDAEVAILSYPPVTKVAAAAKTAPGGSKEADQSWTDSLSLDDITYLIAAVGVVGAVLVGLGIFGIVQARRRPREDGEGVRGPLGGDNGPRVGRQPVPDADADAASGRRPGYDNYDESGWGPPGGGYRPDRPADDYEPAGRRRPAGGGVYGGRSAGGAVYGGQPAGGGGNPAGRPGAGGGVYGGSLPPASGVYGGSLPPASGVYGGVPGGRPGPNDYRDGRPANGHGGQYGQPRQRRGGHPDDYDHR